MICFDISSTGTQSLSRTVYLTSLSQLVDSWPMTVTCVYAAGMCHKSINWVMRFLQAPEVWNSALWYSKTSARLLLCPAHLKNVLLLHSEYYGILDWCLWHNDCVCINHRGRVWDWAAPHLYQSWDKGRLHIKTSPHSQAWFLFSVTTVVIVFQCHYEFLHLYVSHCQSVFFFYTALIHFNLLNL